MSSLFAIAAASGAHAADSGFYTDFDLGLARFPRHGTIELPGLTLQTVNPAPNALMVGLGGGYRFSRYIALEAGYVDLGKPTAGLVDVSGANPVQGHLALTAKGETVALISTLPFGNWDLSLKAGYLFADTKLSVSVSGPGGTRSGSVSASNTAALLGLSVGYELNTHWHVKLGLDHYNHIGDEGRTGRVNVNASSVGIDYRF